MSELEELTLKEKVDLIYERENLKKKKKEGKEKKFKLPFGGKVSRGKLKKGYATVQIINENKSIGFTKKQIIDGTIKLDDTFHAIEDLDIYYYRGRPFIMQPKHRAKPWNPFEAPKIDPEKETYGHKYIMARMKSDAIKAAGKKIGGMAILVIVGIIIAVYYFFSKGGAAT